MNTQQHPTMDKATAERAAQALVQRYGIELADTATPELGWRRTHGVDAELERIAGQHGMIRGRVIA
jgi:hypothetical protein